MEITLYHGTDSNVVQDLKNCKVDVSKGGGEFGKGFYLGDSRRLAKRRAYHKTKGVYGTADNAMHYLNNTLEVKINIIQLEKFYKKNELNREQGRSLFDKLSKKPKTTGSYSVTPDYDYIVGPVVGRKGRYLCVTQYKFDSKESENVMNKQCLNVKIETRIV
ncbi:DUF3990 domain-containing protein [Aeromonas sp. HMWF014]|uniref:DUF3990 domain-containing protein n=1 Tax=Aeromonas sp. HMWF014 TaxID=2056850 RepID=UPI000D381814|nr:DUF3990 domain-containing protein [Aeromonas sp. HMWF014]PTT49437.1 hypothetical protein DBR19_15890 [Aeromonas sp. HMWF014]